MADLGAWLGASSLLVSLAVLVFGLLQFRMSARKDFVEELRKRVDLCEGLHKTCEQERARLEAVNLGLMMDTRKLTDELLAFHRASGERREPPPA